MQERADTAQITEQKTLTTPPVAVFETPVVESVRARVTDVLQDSQNTQTPSPKTLAVTSKPGENTETMLPVLLKIPSPTPRHIKTMPHRTEPKKHIETTQKNIETPKPLSPQKSSADILAEHRDFLKNNTDAQKIILDAWRKSHRNNKLDDVIFESFIRSKDIEILTTLKALKRIGGYKNWKMV